MRNSSWSAVRCCHRETFGFSVQAKHETNDQICKPDDIIQSDIKIQPDKNCNMSVSVIITLEQEKEEIDCVEFRPCLVHVCCPIQIFTILMPKVITSIYFDNVKIEQPNKVLIKDVLLNNPKGQFCCKHQGMVCINSESV